MEPTHEGSKPLSDFDARELDNLRKLTSHKEIALARAMHYCATNRLCPPQWLVEDVVSLLIELLKREKITRRGRSASRLARFHQELKDVERWFAVKDVQTMRRRARDDETFRRSHPNRDLTEARKRDFEKRRKWLKFDNFECAAKMLVGRDAKTNPPGIRASYREIENKRKNHPELMVGAWFDDAFLKALGFQTSYERDPGTKFTSYSDLI
jgi:hypothetical protein